MNGRQRNTTNAQIGGKKNYSNYDGNCTARHCLSGTYEISHRWIFVRLSVQDNYIFLNTYPLPFCGLIVCDLRSLKNRSILWEQMGVMYFVIC